MPVHPRPGAFMQPDRHRRAFVAAVALAAAALLVARPARAQVSAAGATRYTRADVEFMQGMIAHHGQAIAMAALIPSRTTAASLLALGQRIDISQRDEIVLMETWLRDRKEEVPAAGGHAGHAGMDHPMLMPGMLTPEQMAHLASATGVEFERMFLTGMIQHHEGALAMVAALFSTPGAGQESDAFRFASDVDTDQRAEIRRMRALLDQLGGPLRP